MLNLLCTLGLVLFALAANSFGQIPIASEAEAGKVTILVVDEFGHEITSAKIELTRDGQRIDHFASESSKVITVPYGKYIVEVTAPAFRTEHRVLAVAHPQLWVTQQMTVWVEGESRSHPVLSGEVKQLPATGRVWAKLVGIYNDTNLESPITGGRFFVFEPGLDGMYVLMIIRDGTILDIRQVALHGYKTIQVQLQN